jgi:hypothetical protein
MAEPEEAVANSPADPAATPAPKPQKPREDRKWQESLRTFMVVSVVAMGIVFFGATIVHFQSLRKWIEHDPPDIQLQMQEFERATGGKADNEQREWHARMLLESHALNQRYRQNGAVIYSRVWSGYMGFLTGMVLALCGCVFILGKLREDVNISGKGSDFQAQLVTSSPGMVLALAGAGLIAMSLNMSVKAESADRPVYLPQKVEVSGVDAASVKVAQPKLAAPPTVPEGAGAAQPALPLPPDLQKELEPGGAAGSAPGEER